MKLKYAGKSLNELVGMRVDIELLPENLNSPGSFWLYTYEARKQLDEIDRAILAYHGGKPWFARVWLQQNEPKETK